MSNPMARPADCLFCKIINGDIPSVRIWEDESVFAFLDINPVNPGHTLVIPKTHQEDVFDIADEEYSSLFNSAKKLGRAVKKAMGSKRVGIVVEGFLIPHAHIHLIPINAGNELHSQKTKRATQEELERAAIRIRQEIKQSL
jgi:histidine triad (HIT) family protein